MTEIHIEPSSRDNPRLLFFTVCLGLFMAALNQRALLVSLPTLIEVFDTNLSTVQWTLLAYDLSVIGSVLTLGRMGDLFGRKKIYVTGFLLFVGTSVLCALSQTPAQLILFRALQGIGGSMLLANGRAIISVVLPAQERGRALGLTSTAFHVGFLAGPTLGGWIIDTIGWRWIFYLNVPFGLAGALLGWKFLVEKTENQTDLKIDFSGAILLLLMNTFFLYGLNQLSHHGLGHPLVFSLLLLSAITLWIFIRTELQARTPILSLSLFRTRLFSAAILSLFIITLTQSAIGFLMPFYLQNLKGFSASQMGWMIITNSVVIIIVAPFAGWLSDRFGSRLLCSLGASLIVVGQFLIASLALESTVVRIISPLALSGLGWAVFNAPNQSAILGSVPMDKAGAASGMTVTTARIAGATGIAFAAAIFNFGLMAAGLTQLQAGSPQSWVSSPEIFLRTFNRTVHVVNLLTLLSVFFSVLRGGNRS